MKIKDEFFGHILYPFCDRKSPFYLYRDASTNEYTPVWDIYEKIKKIYDYENKLTEGGSGSGDYDS